MTLSRQHLRWQVPRPVSARRFRPPCYRARSPQRKLRRLGRRSRHPRRRWSRHRPCRQLHQFRQSHRRPPFLGHLPRRPRRQRHRSPVRRQGSSFPLRAPRRRRLRRTPLSRQVRNSISAVGEAGVLATPPERGSPNSTQHRPLRLPLPRPVRIQPRRRSRPNVPGRGW